METYSLQRDDVEIGRFIARKDGHVYVFRKFSDRWDVTKLSSAEVIAAAEAGRDSEALLGEHGATYRISGGSCSCPGFSYRRDCWHWDQVVERS